MADGCFDSLRSGKCLQSHSGRYGPQNGRRVSIPFDRESVSKEVRQEHHRISNSNKVSIPFDRESVAKACYSETCLSNERWVSIFDSLRSGKCLQRRKRRTKKFFPTRSFDSLRSGKCLQRMMVSQYTLPKTTGFDSLQTGKSIQRYSISLRAKPNCMCFDSLQTGKSIQRMQRLCVCVGSQIKSFDSLQTGKSIQSGYRIARAFGH